MSSNAPIDQTNAILNAIAELPGAIQEMVQAIDDTKDDPACFDGAAPTIERFGKLVASITADEPSLEATYSLIGETIVVGFPQGFAANTHEAVTKLATGLLGFIKKAWHTSYGKPELISHYADVLKLYCEETSVTSSEVIAALSFEAECVRMGSTAPPPAKQKGKRQSTANERLTALLSLGTQEALAWKAKDVAFIVGCSPSNLSETRMWQELEKLRESAKQRRRQD